MTRLIDADAFQDEFKDHLEYALKLLTSNGHKNAVEMVESFGKDIKRIITNAPTVQREGWVSVPIEPTPEMLRNMHVWIKFEGKGSDEVTQEYIEFKQVLAAYKAMIQAAPTDTE